jgi:dihydroorotate dehydrogenase
MTYRLVRSAAFRLDPERVHGAALRAHRMLRRFRRPFPVKPVEVMGLEFPNVVGLAAGYDKDAVAWRGLAALGFGHVEVGTVTPRPQPGNPRPRVFRLPDDDALINRMGFPSAGAGAVASRLGGDRGGAVLGISIGPNKDTPTERAADDYAALIDRFAPLADYLAVNVSSPNTPGLRSLQRARELADLLARIVAARDSSEARLVVKLSPDIADGDLPDIVAGIDAAGVDGICLTNTTVTRPDLATEIDEAGGLSGAPLARRSLDVLEQVRAMTGLALIASGGIMTVADARRRLDAGASLVQLYTGFVYAGPALVHEIARLG